MTDEPQNDKAEDIYTCKHDDTVEPHTCPYAEEINGSSRECRCCASCEHECAMDV